MNIGKMMQQAKKMQEDMQKMQAEMAETEVVGESGGGMVKVTMTGAHEVRKIEIDQSLWDERDKELVEDLVAAAVNGATQVVKAKVKEQQQGMMAGMPLPPGFSL